VTKQQIRDRITKAFQQYFGSSGMPVTNLLPTAVTAGKLYEAYVLGIIAERLTLDEGYNLTLKNGNQVALKSSPGPINRTYPVIEVRNGSTGVAEIWTDVEFLSLSASLRGAVGSTRGDYHELDILMVDTGLSGRPSHDRIWLGVECKNTGYNKGLLKEILGIRREMSYLQNARSTRFRRWPRSFVPADPSSCLLVYSTDQAVLDYQDPGRIFGIDFVHQDFQ
jgi:hypothetical protein